MQDTLVFHQLEIEKRPLLSLQLIAFGSGKLHLFLVSIWFRLLCIYVEGCGMLRMHLCETNI